MDRFFGLDKPNENKDGLVLLCTATNNIQQAIIESILRGAEIPYLIKERGSGSAVKIIAGFSMFGTDFYINEDLYEQASELVSVVFQENDEEDTECDDGCDDGEDK